MSAFSRTTQFLNKRDNPLFDDISQPNQTLPFLQTSTPANEPRGRSVSRNAVTDRKETGRSLSRVDTCRRTRSASQCPVSRRNLHYSTSESEAECNKGGNVLKSSGSTSKGGLVGRSDKGVMDQVKDLRRWSSQHSSIETSDSVSATPSGLQTQNYDDTVSTASSGFGSYEKTIKAVCEQKSVPSNQPGASDIYETVRSEVRRAISEIQIDLESAIRRSNATAITATNVADIHPDLVNPDSVELAFEIRREYGKKLEESQDRARSLRADLAVEEHRERELDRILREVLPYPKTPNVQKSRPARRSSIERKRMSRRLAEDAKSYFDECVSLSTFDSSDFSSQEDPPLSMVGPPTPPGNHVCLTKESSIHEQSSLDIHCDILQQPASIDSEAISFTQKPSEVSTLQQDIQQYIKKFEKNVSKLPNLRSNYCELRDYSFQSSAESLLIDRVQLKSKIESGSFLLCGGNIWSSNLLG